MFFVTIQKIKELNFETEFFSQKRFLFNFFFVGVFEHAETKGIKKTQFNFFTKFNSRAQKDRVLI